MKIEELVELFQKNAVTEVLLEKRYEDYLAGSSSSWLKKDQELMKYFQVLTNGSKEHSFNFAEMADKLRLGKARL